MLQTIDDVGVLLDLVTSHASDEEAVRVIFYKYEGKAQAKPTDKAKDHNQ